MTKKLKYHIITQGHTVPRERFHRRPKITNQGVIRYCGIIIGHKGAIESIGIQHQTHQAGQQQKHPIIRNNLYYPQQQTSSFFYRAGVDGGGSLQVSVFSDSLLRHSSF